jgi:type II secretory pathway component PulC
MKLLMSLSLALILSLMLSVAWAATVTLNLVWQVTNTPSIVATHYRIDESVAGVWVSVATVPATQLAYSITGRAVGQSYTFSIMPLNGGVPGIRSNVSVCGTVVTSPPTTTLTFSCTPIVVP